MLKKFISYLTVVSLFSSVTLAQNAAPQTTATNQTPPSVAANPAKPPMQGFGIEEGTPVKLRTARTISSADAHTGDTLDFEVLEDVFAGGTLVIPKGGIAWGTVTEAEPKRRMGRGGKLNVNIDSVRLTDGEKAPFFLFMHGKDITIPKGTEITAYINGDTRLDQAKFQPPANASPAAVASATTAQFDISSTPAGADIEIDGKFVGSTPSSVTVAPGDHDIVVKKNGFIAWERKITASTGHVNLSAELAPEAK